MKPQIDVHSIEWWLWTITLVLLTSAVAGWTPGYYLFAALTFGTAMVVLFDRCFIALVPQEMPWNRGKNTQCKLL